MRKINILVAIIFVLGIVSTYAQQSVESKLITPPMNELIVLQDDGSGGFLMFDPNTGAYKIQMCKSGYAWEGTGQIKIDGPSIFLSVVQPGCRMFVVVDMLGHQGKSTVDLFKEPKSAYPLIEPIYEEWSDSDMRDSKMDCVSDKK